MLNKRLLSNALQSLLNRLDEIDRQCAGGFPLYAVGDSDKWLLSKGGSWMGGFWTGCWWLRAYVTKNAADYVKAEDLCEKLSDKIHLDSSYRSLIFWYGAALGDVWFKNATAKNLTQQAATALAASYDAKLLCVPLGTALAGGEHGKNVVTVDGLASLIDLLNYGGDGEYTLIARQHTDTLIAACLTENGAFHSEAHYANGQFQTKGVAGDWSRGQAWAMLGLTHAAKNWGEPYLTKAQLACDYWLNSRLQPFPLNRLSEPAGLNDPSASVIAALAMLSLAEQVAESEKWRALAHQQLIAVVTSEYFNDGLFSGCCYQIKPQQLALVESSWGIFLLTSVLTALNLIHFSNQ